MRMRYWSSDVCSSDRLALEDAVRLSRSEYGPAGIRIAGRPGFARDAGRPLSPVAVRQESDEQAFRELHRRRPARHLGGGGRLYAVADARRLPHLRGRGDGSPLRSEEHTSELQSLMRNPY